MEPVNHIAIPRVSRSGLIRFFRTRYLYTHGPGFGRMHSWCRWMQRPAEHYEVNWGDNLRIESPEVEADEAGTKRFVHETEIARCDYDGSRL